MLLHTTPSTAKIQMMSPPSTSSSRRAKRAVRHALPRARLADHSPAVAKRPETAARRPIAMSAQRTNPCSVTRPYRAVWKHVPFHQDSIGSQQHMRILWWNTAQPAPVPCMHVPCGGGEDRQMTAAAAAAAKPLNSPSLAESKRPEKLSSPTCERE